MLSVELITPIVLLLENNRILHIFVILCRFLQISTLESWYNTFSTSIGYFSAYLCGCYPGKNRYRGLSRWQVNIFFSHHCLFSEIFVFFFIFQHWNHGIFDFQLVQSTSEYSSAYAYNRFHQKILNKCPSGGNHNESLFSYFRDFCYVLQIYTVESCYNCFPTS